MIRHRLSEGAKFRFAARKFRLGGLACGDIDEGANGPLMHSLAEYGTYPILDTGNASPFRR